MERGKKELKISKPIKEIEQQFKKIKSYFKRKRLKDFDKIYFSFEQLPIRGKEYWFMFFTSAESKNGKQFLVMFGDQNVNKFKVDGKEITKKIFNEKKASGVLSTWYYNKRAVILPTLPVVMEIKKGKIYTTGENREFLFSGKYPRYNLKLTEDAKEICNLELSLSKGGKKYDVVEHFQGKFGFGYVNLYLDFKGKLKGSAFKGKCYIQKVVITAQLPSIPWNWGRIYFKNGSIFEFLYPYLSLYKVKQKLLTTGYYYDARDNKTYSLEKVDVQKIGKKNPHFLVNAASKNKKMSLMLKAYATKKFTIKSIGELRYNEHLVNVNSLSAEGFKKSPTSKSLGNGVGLVEDGSGLVI